MAKWKWLLVAVVVLIVPLAWFLLPFKMWVMELHNVVQALGWWSVVIFIAIYAIATILMAPGAPMSISGGLVFGWWGIPIVTIGAGLGCSASFLLARWRQKRRKNANQAAQLTPKQQAIHEAICAEDWKVVLLMRLSPLVPFNLQNYFFGFTDIRFSRYLAASIVGMLPGTMLYVYLGMLSADMSLQNGETLHSQDWLQWGFFSTGLVLTVLVTWRIGRKAKAILHMYGVEG